MQPIYLDYNATTPIAPEVQQALLPFLAEQYGNPSSGHSLGRASHEAVEDARTRVAGLLGCHADEIVFTSCGTESNNLALKGVAFRRAMPLRGHLVISSLEHPAITEPAKFLGRLGLDVTVVPCGRDGMVDPDAVIRALRRDTLLVSVMHANNEIGTIQPIGEIARRCREQNVTVHTDAAQSAGKIAVDVDALGVDLLSIAGHKLYAPKGVGALYVRRGVALESVLHGAGQEHGLRAGTENVPYLVGLGAAAESAAGHLKVANESMAALRDRLFERLSQRIGEPLEVNGGGGKRLPNTLSINFPRVAAEEMLRRVPELCASTGAACHSGSTHMSTTLQAIGLSPTVARGTMRLSVGRFTSEEEVDRAADLLSEAWRALQP